MLKIVVTNKYIVTTKFSSLHCNTQVPHQSKIVKTIDFMLLLNEKAKQLKNSKLINSGVRKIENYDASKIYIYYQKVN